MSQTISADQQASDAERLYRRPERIALAIGALVMLGIVAASVLIAARTDTDLGDAARSQAIRAVTVDLLGEVTQAETGQRGYLLTGKTEYLGPYNEAVDRIPKLMAQLSGLLPNDAQVAEWRTNINEKIAELAQTLQLAQSGRRTDALAIVDTDRGKHAMDAVKALSERLAIEQRASLRDDLARSQLGARILVAVDAFAFVMLALLVLFVGRGARRSLQSLSETQASLRDANRELAAGQERLEQAVAERTADLTEANAEIQRFAYIVSHDLRAPLLNIIGFTSELEVATNRLNRFVSENLAGVEVPQDVREASEEDLPEAIRFIQTSTSKMDRLISAILRLSREGRRVLTPEPIDMGALISGVVDSMRHQADAKGAEITIGQLPRISSDRIALEQVFSNVVENALKYGVAGRTPRIQIEGSRQGAFVCYVVRDNGRGIQARDMERVFELFRRAGTQDQAGEGIGLAHVRTLVRRLGGTIDCESVFGEGSAFMVRLPLSPTRATVPPMAHEAKLRAGDIIPADGVSG